MKLKLTNYRVIQKIGHGGMGLVYVAEDLALGRLVALKVLAPYLVQDPEILERFRTEARNQARLIHPNITMVYSFLVEEQQAFLVLEFIDGETLESRINREGRIVVVEAVAIFRKILAAIDYAHSKGVIHRDIKPGNIAFTADGHVKLMDFGIALNIEEGGRLTRTGHVLGTPHYMAPEQILGQEVTFATDIYALGITLYEMLTGRLPFDSKSDYEVRIAQVNHPPPPPRSLGFPDISADLEEVILKSLAKAPVDRFASAEDFLQDLEDAVKCDHAVTMVKGRRLDRSTQAVKKPRKAAPPPAEPERAEPPAPSPEPEIEESVPAPASPTAEPPVPPAAEVPGEEPATPLALGPQLEVSPGPPPDEAQDLSGSPPLEPQIEAAPISPPVTRQEEESPALKLSERPEISVAPLIEALAEPKVAAPAEMQAEAHLSPPPETQLDQIFVPPLFEAQPEESQAVGHPEAEESSELPPLEPGAGLPVSSFADLLRAEPPTPPPELQMQMEEPAAPGGMELPEEPLPEPLVLEPQPGEPPGPPPEIQLEESSAPPPMEPPPPESLVEGYPEVQELSDSPATGEIAELPVSSQEAPQREDPHAAFSEAPREEPLGPSPVELLKEEAVSPPDELPAQAASTPQPLAPPMEMPAEGFLEEQEGSPPPQEVSELPGATPVELPRAETWHPAAEPEMAGLPSPPPPKAERQALVALLAGVIRGLLNVLAAHRDKLAESEGLAAAEPAREFPLPQFLSPRGKKSEARQKFTTPRAAAEPPASPTVGRQSSEATSWPVPESPVVLEEARRGRGARSRLLFLPLALLPLLALVILFRANIFPGPAVTPQARLSPPPGATAAQPEAAPSRHAEAKAVVAARPPTEPPLNPVPKESANPELGKVAKDQPEKEKPVMLAALPATEKKVETPEVKEPKPVDLQKTIKERLAADGFPDLQVLMDAKKGAVVSGKVKNLAQKKRVIQIVNSMGLSTSVDYSNLKIPREVVVETIKKKVQEERPRITRTPEARPRPAPTEAPRKPLPPRLDRGNIQF